VRHAAQPTEPARTDDSPGASPSEIPVASTPAAPSTSHENEVEAGDDDGIHQHRGGRTETAVENSGAGSATSGSSAAETAAPAADDSPEVENHHGGDDSSSDDGGSHGGGGSSGHGGGDD
jgi:hypothetical protein